MVNNITIITPLEPLMYNQDWIHLSEISRMLKIPHPTLRQHLNLFEKKGIVLKQIKGRLTNYKINYDNPLIIDYLVMIEKNKLINKCSKELLLKEVTSFLHGFNNSLLIFGSAVNNLKNANDLDILIIGDYSKQSINDCQNKLGIKFHIIQMKDLSEVKLALKKEIIQKHLIINNSEEIIRWMLKN